MKTCPIFSENFEFFLRNFKNLIRNSAENPVFKHFPPFFWKKTKKTTFFQQNIAESRKIQHYFLSYCLKARRHFLPKFSHFLRNFYPLPLVKTIDNPDHSTLISFAFMCDLFCLLLIIFLHCSNRTQVIIIQLLKSGGEAPPTKIFWLRP